MDIYRIRLAYHRGKYFLHLKLRWSKELDS